jgi:hypothetical protein
MIELKIKYNNSNYSQFGVSFTFTTKNIEIFIDQHEMIVSTHIDKFLNIYAREHYNNGSLIQWGLFNCLMSYYIGPRLRMWNNNAYYNITFSDILGYGMTYDQFIYYYNNDDELSQLCMKFYNDMSRIYHIKK